MATARHVILSRLRILALTEFAVTLTIGGAPELKQVPLGLWYLDSTTAAESIRAQLKTLFDSHASVAVFTVTFSLLTGKFTISSDGLNFDLTWSGTGLRDMLGFTGNKAGANTYTSDNVAQFVIYPESGREDWNDVDYEQSSRAAVSEAGTMSAISPGTELVSGGYTHPWEPKLAVASPLSSGAFDAASVQVPWTMLDHWRHHCRLPNGLGEPFRYYMDSAGAITSYEDEYVFHESNYPRFRKKRVIKGSDRYWAVETAVRKYVTPT